MSDKIESTGMDLLKEIANVSGKGGLFRILKPSRAGVIVESLDEKHEKTLIGPTARVSVLKDVSIFTDGEQESAPLEDVFASIREIHGEQIELNTKTASDKDLIEFLVKVLPDFDRSKVYVSDIKKVISWYNILSKYVPEIFVAPTEVAPTEVAPTEVAPTEVPTTEVATATETEASTEAAATEETKDAPAAKKSSKKEKSDA